MMPPMASPAGMGMAAEPIGMPIQGGTVLLPPYEDKEKPKRAPSLRDVLELSERLRRLFSLRDAYVRYNRDMVNLLSRAASNQVWRRTDDPDDDFTIRLSQPDTIINKAAAITGSLEETIQIAAKDNTEQADRESQRPVSFLRQFGNINRRRWLEGGGSNALGIDENRAGYIDGRMYWRLVCDPKDEAHPWRLDLTDCLEVYPHYVGNRLKAVLHITRMLVEEAREQWGSHLLSGKKTDDEVEVIGYYDDTFHGVICEEEWLKTPKPHGYKWFPWILVHVRGQHASSATISRAMTADEKEANRGRGVLWAFDDMFDAKARMWSAMMLQVTKAVNPPVDFKYGDNDVNVEAPSDLPGAKNPIPQGVDYPKPRPPVGDLPYIAAFMTSIENAIDAGLIPSALGDARSGFDRTLILQQNEVFFKPMLEAVSIGHSLIYESALKLFKQFGVETVVLGESDFTGMYLWPFTPAMVPEQPMVTVAFEEMSRINQMQAIQALTPARQAGIVSNRFIHEKIGTKDVDQELSRAQEDMALMHPMAQQMLAPWYAYASATKLRDASMQRGDQMGALLAELISRAVAKQIQQTFGQEPQMPGSPAMGAMTQSVGGAMGQGQPPMPLPPAPPSVGGQVGPSADMMAALMGQGVPGVMPPGGVGGPRYSA